METVQVNADALIEKLGMQREDEVTSVRENESVIIVTDEGITSGKVTAMYGEMSTTRYKYFYLHDVLLFEERYILSENGWETEPTATRKLSTEAILYKK